MKIEDIPADVLVEMTPELYQEFCLGGCVPMCHLTLQPIRIGELFKLAKLTAAIRSGSNNFNKLETTDVMLSQNASAEEFEKRHKDAVYQEELRRKRGGGCFRVNGKIVIE